MPSARERAIKAKLKIAIDKLIPVSADLDDLLQRLKAEGYEIKRGKYIAFCAPDLAKLKADYKRITAEKDALYTEYGKLKEQFREYDAVKQNIDSILHPACGREQKKAL